MLLPFLWRKFNDKVILNATLQLGNKMKHDPPYTSEDLDYFYNTFGKEGINMICKITKVYDNVKTNGEPYKTLVFDNGLKASAFEVNLFEHCIEGNEVDVTIIKKGQYMNIVKILPVIQEGSQEPKEIEFTKEDADNMAEEELPQEHSKKTTKPLEREPSDIHIIRESSVKSAAPIFAEMIKIDGMKEIGSEDLIIIAKRIESYIKTGV